jgi:hypothetical protein
LSCVASTLIFEVVYTLSKRSFSHLDAALGVAFGAVPLLVDVFVVANCRFPW